MKGGWEWDLDRGPGWYGDYDGNCSSSNWRYYDVGYLRKLEKSNELLSRRRLSYFIRKWIL